MAKPIDLIGQRFGRLTVLDRAENSKAGKTRWLCQCDCGKKTFVTGSHLRNKRIKSCGCFGREQRAKANTTHGQTNSRLYRIWTAMRERCYYPSQRHYKDYGARGITICPEWLHDFAAFRDWALAHGYRDDLSIDRIDVNGNYCPENCRWATAKEQANNKRPRRTLKTE